MGEIFKLFGTIGINNKEAEKGIDGTTKKAKDSSGKMAEFFKKAAKAIAAVFVADKLFDFAKSTVEAAATAEAITAQFEQVFGDIQEKAQKTVDKLGKDFGMLPNRIKPAFTQTTSMFKGLGLSTEEAMGQAENAVTLVADAAAFYDKSFEDANSALNSFIKGNYEGGESIGLFANETQMAAWAAKNLGIDWKSLDEAGKQIARLEYAKAMQESAGATGQAARESDNYENVIGNLKQAWEDLKVKLGQPLLGPVVKVIQNLVEWLGKINVQPVVDGFNSIIQAAGWVIQQFKNWFTSNEESLDGIWQKIQEVFGFIADYWRSVWEGIRTFWQENGQQIWDTAVFYFTQIWQTIETVFNAIRTIIEMVLSYVVPWIQEKLAVLQQFWQENGAQIMAAVEKAFSFIRGVIEFVMPIIQGIISGAWSIIRSIFDTAIGIIMGLVKIFSGLLTGDFSSIKEGLTKIWSSLWSGIKGIVSGAWDLLSGAFSGLWESISGWFTGLVEDAASWGKDLIKGFWEGIKGTGKWISDKVSGFVDKHVPGPIKKLLGIASPSKLMMQFGEFTGEGYAMGLDKMGNRVAKASEAMANFATEPVYDAAAVTTDSRNIISEQSISNTANTSKLEAMLSALLSLTGDLINAVRENKDFIIDGRTFAKVTGDYTDVEGGRRIRKVERGLAT